MNESFSTGELLLIIVCLSLATFATRAGILLIGDRLTLSRRIEAALRFAPVCALTALVLPEVLYPEGVLAFSLSNPRLPAAVAAAALLLWKPSIGGGIAVGMAVYALVRFL